MIAIIPILSGGRAESQWKNSESRRQMRDDQLVWQTAVRRSRLMGR